MIDKLKTIPHPFPLHKVKIKSISVGSPSMALAYILNTFDGITVTIDKQRDYSLIIKIHCSDAMYEYIKLGFVKDMGQYFIWKD